MHAHMLVRNQTTRVGPEAMPKPSTTPDTEQTDEAAVRRKLKATNVELPAYVWEQVRTYLDEHPEQRVRHMIMAGFQALGLKIDPEDLVAERRRGPGG